MTSRPSRFPCGRTTKVERWRIGFALTSVTNARQVEGGPNVNNHAWPSNNQVRDLVNEIFTS